MRYTHMVTAGMLAIALGAAGCGRDTTPDDTTTTAAADEAAREAARADQLRRDREQEIARMDERVSAIQRNYQEKTADAPRGTSGRATARLRDEVSEDVTNVQKALAELRTTTADNWWDRHEQAMTQTAADVEADVKRLVGVRTLPAAPPDKADAPAAADGASAAAFTSRRDRFVAEVRARVDAMEQALDKVKIRGARQTELDDVKARVEKLGDDVDRLRSASADDWWDLTKTRVSEYVDRVEDSVERLADNPRQGRN